MSCATRSHEIGDVSSKEWWPGSRGESIVIITRHKAVGCCRCCAQGRGVSERLCHRGNTSEIRFDSLHPSQRLPIGPSISHLARLEVALNINPLAIITSRVPRVHRGAGRIARGVARLHIFKNAFQELARLTSLRYSCLLFSGMDPAQLEQIQLHNLNSSPSSSPTSPHGDAVVHFGDAPKVSEPPRSDAHHVDVSYFDPSGVNELRRTMSQMSSSRKSNHGHSALPQDVKKNRTSDDASDLTLTPGDGPFDFEKTLKHVVRR